MAINIPQSIASEISDFLVSLPDLEALANYKVSESLQQYIDSLLDKNSAGEISAEERLELEKILAVSHVMTLAKTKAKLKLEQQQ
jgi:hypothetical protein